MDLSIITIVAVVIVILAITIPIGYKRNKFKREVLGGAIKEIFPDSEYLPDKYMSKAEYDELGCMRRGMFYKGSDLLLGKTQGGRAFRYSEVNTYDKTDKTTVTVFHGAVFSFKYSKNFNSRVYLCSNRGWGREAFKSEFLKTHKLETENEDFNSMYRVYSDDDITAFYLLTPHVMERFMQLKDNQKNAIFVSFKDEWMHIMIPNVDLFKAPVIGFKNKVKIEKFVNKAKDDIDQILNFVDMFEIDSKAFCD